MENCQLIIYAKELKDVLCVHDKAVIQMNLLENIIQKLDQQLFRSTSEGKHGQTLHLLTKKSVTQGVRKMYQEYINRKQEVIKELSALIIQSLQEGVSTNITDLQQQNISVNQRDSDNFIVHVTEDCCESSRSV